MLPKLSLTFALGEDLRTADNGKRGQNAISESFTGKMMTEQTDGVDE